MQYVRNAFLQILTVFCVGTTLVPLSKGHQISNPRCMYHRDQPLAIIVPSLYKTTILGINLRKMVVWAGNCVYRYFCLKRSLLIHRNVNIKVCLNRYSWGSGKVGSEYSSWFIRLECIS